MTGGGRAHGTCYARVMNERVRGPEATAWIALAAALHAAAIASLFSVRVDHGHDVPAGSAESAEIALDLEGEPERAAPRVDEPRRPLESNPSDTRTAGLAVTHPPSRASSGAPAGAAAPPSASSSEPMRAPQGNGEATSSSSSAGVAPIPFTPEQLGIGGAGGRNPFLPRHEETVPTSGRDAPAARAMRGTGLARDRELGLGPEGPVVSALADATSSSLAPVRGRAVFLVRANGDGLVSGIDVIDSEGGSGWIDAGKIALEKLRGKKLKIPTGAKGMNMRIEVLSEMKVPSGQDSLFGARQGENKMPEMTIPDPADIGAKPRRVVRSHVVSTEAL